MFSDSNDFLLSIQRNTETSNFSAHVKIIIFLQLSHQIHNFHEEFMLVPRAGFKQYLAFLEMNALETTWW